MSWGVMLLNLSSLSFGTENSLQNYKKGVNGCANLSAYAICITVLSSQSIKVSPPIRIAKDLS
jgi:hypothetical protein